VRVSYHTGQFGFQDTVGQFDCFGTCSVLAKTCSARPSFAPQRWQGNRAWLRCGMPVPRRRHPCPARRALSLV
jgi:hypothetical protein